MNSKKIVPNDLVPIGKILKAHGLLGEVKAFLYNVDSDSLKPEINIWLNIKNEFIFSNNKYFIYDINKGESICDQTLGFQICKNESSQVK